MKEKLPTSKVRENPDDHFDTEMRHKAVMGGVASHQTKMTDENRLGIPDLDESINQDRIRNRIEPPVDLINGREIFKVETIKQPEGDYEKDLKKLKTFTPDELKKLLNEIQEKSRRGLFSKGDLLNGYAIDPQSLKSLQSIHHDTIAFELATKIAEKLLDPNISNYNLTANIQRRIIPGLVYLPVPGFKTPIVKLYLGVKEMGNLVPEEDVKKIANYLKSERKLLPINSFFKVL